MPEYNGDGPPRIDEDFSSLSQRPSVVHSSSATNSPSTDQSESGIKFLLFWVCIAVVVLFVLPSYATIVSTIQEYNPPNIQKKAKQTKDVLLSLLGQSQSKPTSSQRQINTISIGDSFQILNSGIATTSSIKNIASVQGAIIPTGTSRLYYFFKYRNYKAGHQFFLHLTKGQQEISYRSLKMKKTNKNGTGRITTKYPFTKGHYRLRLSDMNGELNTCFFTVH